MEQHRGKAEPGATWAPAELNLNLSFPPPAYSPPGEQRKRAGNLEGLSDGHAVREIRGHHQNYAAILRVPD
jgi:hypothetical protein